MWEREVEVATSDGTYALPDRDLYVPDATRRDWVAIKEMLRRQLKMSAD
jgi:hypothetical protein